MYSKPGRSARPPFMNTVHKQECTTKHLDSIDTVYNWIIPWARVGYVNKSRHLARKYARIFVRGHYLFREANSFPRAKLEENCELRGTDNVQGQISEHIFAPNGDYCLYYPSNLFRNARSFENWGIFMG